MKSRQRPQMIELHSIVCMGPNLVAVGQRDSTNAPQSLAMLLEGYHAYGLRHRSRTQSHKTDKCESLSLGSALDIRKLDRYSPLKTRLVEILNIVSIAMAPYLWLPYGYRRTWLRLEVSPYDASA
jgi:hypothetical protein